MKYSKEFKLEMIKKKKNNEEIPHNSNYKNAYRWHDKIRHWERIYDKLGEKGLEHNKSKFTFEEKLNFMLKIENGESATSIGESK